MPGNRTNRKNAPVALKKPVFNGIISGLVTKENPVKMISCAVLLFILAGCEAPVVKAEVKADPDALILPRIGKKRHAEDKVEYVSPNRVALSSYWESSMVYLTGTVFHDNFNCPKVGWTKGETIFFRDVVAKSYQPCNYCIDRKR